MNVLFATHPVVSLHQGGIRTQMLQTKAALEQRGVNVALYEMWKDYDISSYDLVHIFAANMATYHFARALRVRHIPFVITPVFFSQRSAKVIKTVVTCDQFINRFLRGIWTDFGIIAELCNWAHAVLPNTQAEAQLLINGMEVPRERIRIIPNGVEERFACATPDLFIRQYELEDFILFVGQIGAQRKNVYRLLQALERIDHPSVIIGTIESTQAGRECLERAKRNPQLLIINELSHDSMLLASAYAASKVFVLPSLYETPGIAAMEAALAGSSIVITKYGGTREYFQDDAEYIEPTSIDDIERGIRTALKKQPSNNLRQRLLARFTWNNVGEKMKNLYEWVLQ
ncbi:MAG: glycosyltransferase family 4 protein [Bacteroidetes bacterium]|nr:glycosyltransferase family 4 protein [Bacteroidota bacterium]